ncbi:MAG: glycosyltransferase [Vulcanimicrobiaceae bacterium]
MSAARRRLLFLSYWVPPRNAIGTLRSTHIVKHLAEFGWDVTTVTASFNHDNGAKLADYIETGYWDVKGSIKTFLGIGKRSTSEVLNLGASQYGAKRNAFGRFVLAAAGLMTYPDDYVGWLPFAFGATRKLLAGGKWDAVLTSSPPATANLAAALSHRGVPWIADLRDLWAEDDSSERPAFQRQLDDKLERACLSRAAALVAASELSARRFRRRYPGKPCFPISTGFDAQEWQSVGFGSERECTLLYAGSLYRGKRDPSVLFAALREIFDERSAEHGELRVDFYADPEPWLMDLIASFELQDSVRVHGFVERPVVLAAERHADRLVVFSWDGPTAEGVVAGKLFEYFGARRPVLAIGGPPASAVEDLLVETGAGVRCRTVEQTKVEVLKALSEHRSGEQRVIDAAAVYPYNGEACARRFAEVLDYAVSERAGVRAGEVADVIL